MSIEHDIRTAYRTAYRRKQNTPRLLGIYMRCRSHVQSICHLIKMYIFKVPDLYHPQSTCTTIEPLVSIAVVRRDFQPFVLDPDSMQTA
jgi:hypothetical protein